MNRQHHSSSTPAKKMNNSILNYFPKKPTDSNSGARGASQTGEKVQKRMNLTRKKKGNNGRDPLKERKNDSFKDKVKESPSKSRMQQCDEGQSHTFNFCYQNKKHAVACDTSKTVIDALNTNKIFKKIKKDNMEKEIVIKRSNGKVFGAAVKTDFPCCLIEKDELLDITFIKNTGNVDIKKKTTIRLSFSNESENIVIFYIKTKGGDKVKRLMKNHELRKEVEDVCVYAFKEDKLKDALRRDGRFSNAIFKRQCALREFGSEINHVMSNTVEHLDQKHFKIIVISDNNQPESQEDFLSGASPEMNEASAADLKENVDSNQHPVNTEQEETQKRNAMKSTNTSAKYSKIIDSEEILGILRSQIKGLMETLKQRENLKKKSEVRTFFRAEYDKSVQSFLEVKKVKQLTKLSEHVCQIRVEGSARGTGFLLFDRFILTNAHVIEKSSHLATDITQFTAEFDHEFDHDSQIKRISVKQLAVNSYGKDDSGRYLDYALLELDSVDEIAEYPKLLSCYSPNPPNRGQICIVGHPGEGVKKMDPCIIIERENRVEVADKHANDPENKNVLHVMKEVYHKEKWDFSAYKNQITYDSCFFHGSSGSPVFDVDCKLIGIHTGGYKYKEEGTKTWSVMEYGFSMQAILEDLEAQANKYCLHEIVKNLEEYKNKARQGKIMAANEQNQTDVEMVDAEKPKES